MLEIYAAPPEEYDEENERFVQGKGYVLQLEHSLISLSKWEEKWHKPFLAKTAKTPEETLDYIRHMTINKNVPDDVYGYLTSAQLAQISAYIEDPHTATIINDRRNASTSSEVITSELIYYWMIALTIPPQYEKWHLNRLITLIQVCNIKNDPKPKKMSTKDLAAQRRALNSQRRQSLGTTG